jgi:outer membrane protein assembly factor BamE (lipoprotein component of BamABCDE complex)
MKSCRSGKSVVRRTQCPQLEWVVPRRTNVRSLLRITVLLLTLMLVGCVSLGAVGTIGTIGAIGTVGAFKALGSTTGTTAANDDTAIRKIKIGASRKPEVRKLLGEPSVAYPNLLIDGRTVDVWAYRYSHHQQDLLILVPILNFYSTQGTSDSSSVNVLFDVDGIVSDVRVTRYR